MINDEGDSDSDDCGSGVKLKDYARHPVDGRSEISSTPSNDPMSPIRDIHGAALKDDFGIEPDELEHNMVEAPGTSGSPYACFTPLDTINEE